MCLRDLIAREIAPALTNEASIRIIHMVETALGELFERAEGRSQILAESQDAQRTAIAAAIELLRREDAPQHGLASVSALGPVVDRTGSLGELYAKDRESRLVLAQLSKQIAALIPKAGRGRWCADARAWIQTVVLEEITRETHKPSAPASPQASDESRLRMLATRVLTRCFPLEEPTCVDMKRIEGGYSRETFALNGVFSNGRDVALIVRRQKANGLLDGIGLSLDEEYPFMRFAHDNGLPVPRVLWLEGDREGLGEKFMVMEKAPGINLGTGIALPGRVDKKPLRALARLLAKLHNTPWEKASSEILHAARLPVSGDISINSAFETTLARWIEFSARSGNSPSPALEASIQWLADNIPESQSRLSLLHGDVGFHNILFLEGKITALLDWELADLGDPARDLALVRGVVEQQVPWSDFVRWYREAGGGDVSESALSYYQIYGVAISLILERTGLESKFINVDPPDIEMLHLGLAVLPHFYEQLDRFRPFMWEDRTKIDG